MGVFYETIPQSMIKWILEQKVFWVATAPLSGRGHVNVSPKGGQYFGVIDEKTFWYIDLTGSGNETISHILEPGNGRITIQLNAFDGPPKIVRLWGKGKVLENGTSAFNDFVDQHKVELIPGVRSIIIVDVHQVGSSCGFSVPYYDFKDYRPILNDFFAKKDAKFKAGKTDESMDRYWAYKNAWSMDGLPGMRRAMVAGKKEKVAPIVKMIGPLAPRNGVSYYDGLSLTQALVIALLSFFIGVLVALYGGEGKVIVERLIANADTAVLRNMVTLHSDAPELPLHPVSARITAMIRSTPKKATTEHLDRVVCTVYPTSNRTKAIDGDQEQEWAMQFSRPDDLIRFVEPGTEFWLGGNEVEAYECV